MKLKDRGDASIIYVGKHGRPLKIGSIVMLFAEEQKDHEDIIIAKVTDIEGENYEGEIVVHTINPAILPLEQKSINFKESNIIVYK